MRSVRAAEVDPPAGERRVRVGNAVVAVADVPAAEQPVHVRARVVVHLEAVGTVGLSAASGVRVTVVVPEKHTHGSVKFRPTALMPSAAGRIRSPLNRQQRGVPKTDFKDGKGKSRRFLLLDVGQFCAGFNLRTVSINYACCHHGLVDNDHERESSGPVPGVGGRR